MAEDIDKDAASYRPTSPSYSLILRLEIKNDTGMFALIAETISRAGGRLGFVELKGVERGRIIRDISFDAFSSEHEDEIVRKIKKIPGVRVRHVQDKTFLAHRGGKIEIVNRVPVRNMEDLSKVYTPGVARVCMDIRDNPAHSYRYTMKRNTIAIVTDGTAVLGLGDIGPAAAMPVMEGKAMIFKEFAGLNAFPIGLSTKDPDEIVSSVERMSISFGGVNLEDISAPRCFEIEARLRESLDIPVIHDDQHGTAVVVLAALINVGRLMKRSIRKLRVVIAGAGAAGSATASILRAYGVRDIVMYSRRGILGPRMRGLDRHRRELLTTLNPRGVKGDRLNALKGADVFIGLSAPDTLKPEDIGLMARHPVVFALANPDPEITPEEAMPLVRIMATGRSDYPNQINNMLSFPGIFRGLLDAKARGVNNVIKLAAAEAIASIIKDSELHEDYIIPSIFNRKVVSAVSGAVSDAAIKTGLSKGRA